MSSGLGTLASCLSKIYSAIGRATWRDASRMRLCGVLTPMMPVGLSVLIASTNVDTGPLSWANGFWKSRRSLRDVTTRPPVLNNPLRPRASVMSIPSSAMTPVGNDDKSYVLLLPVAQDFGQTMAGTDRQVHASRCMEMTIELLASLANRRRIDQWHESGRVRHQDRVNEFPPIRLSRMLRARYKASFGLSHGASAI